MLHKCVLFRFTNYLRQYSSISGLTVSFVWTNFDFQTAFFIILSIYNFKNVVLFTVKSSISVSNFDSLIIPGCKLLSLVLLT